MLNDIMYHDLLELPRDTWDTKKAVSLLSEYVGTHIQLYYLMK